MSLWGKNDNKLSTGTVSVNHANRTVVGSGTTFGVAGNGVVGDIIRFGQPLSGADGYFGEAVIVSVASTLSIKLDSVEGLSARDITDKAYQVTQSPKSTPTDAAFNKFSRAVEERGDLKITTAVSGDVAIGGTSITITGDASASSLLDTDVLIITHGERRKRRQFSEVYGIVSGGSTILVKNGLKGVHNIYKTDGTEYNIGASSIILREALFRATFDGGIDGAHIDELSVGDTFTAGTNSIGIGTINDRTETSATVVLNTGLTQKIDASIFGAKVTIKRGALSGSLVEVRGKETVSGDETQVLGVSTDGTAHAASSAFAVAHAGWVGVTTYMDMHGNLRVKKETLVAMSGIATGNAPIYDSNPFA
jgi:hypothetical protein